MRVKFCYNRKTKYGIETVDNIDQGTKNLFYDSEIVCNAQTKKWCITKQKHLLILCGTGLAINGNFKILFPDKIQPDINKFYEIPCNLMSFTNSSRNYKNKTNCILQFIDDYKIY